MFTLEIPLNNNKLVATHEQFIEILTRISNCRFQTVLYVMQIALRVLW